MTAFASSDGAGTVTANCLNFREGATIQSNILKTADCGEPVLVLDTTDSSWYQVYYNNTVGYMRSEFLSVSDSEIAEFGTASCGEDGADILFAPGSESELISSLQPGTALDIMGVDGDWYYVSGDDVMGYVQSESIDFLASSVTDTGENSIGDSIVAEAISYLGVPYVYGGTSPSGFDCSGLVNYIYMQNGYPVNRTADSLMNNGVAVESLMPGDLVFFANGSGGSIGHVGIYIGDGQFVHASSGSGQVRISNLDESYYASYYCGARRIVE